MKLRHRLALAAAAILAATAAQAQNYPAKSVRLIVPFGPGGATDVNARIMAPKLSERLGQPVVVENRPGGGGIVGMQATAQSAPDGYTLLLATIGIASNVGLHGDKLPFDPLKDFTAISMTVVVPTVLAVHPGVPVKNARELIQYAKDNPGKLNFGSAASGTINHLAGELLKSLTGTNMIHVPYKSGGAAVAALLSGEISMLFATTSSSLPHYKSGKLVPIAVSSAKRIAALPDVPPLGDTVQGFDAVEWQGVVGPANLPKPVVERLYKDVVATMNDPVVRDRLVSTGSEIVASSPAEFDAHIKAEVAKWVRVAKQTGMKGE